MLLKEPVGNGFKLIGKVEGCHVNHAGAGICNSFREVGVAFKCDEVAVAFLREKLCSQGILLCLR